MFPMTITKQSARARSVSGGKDYHLVLVWSESEDKALLIERWGKTGKWGQMRISTGNKATITKAYETKYHEKWDREYRDHYKSEKTFAHNETELRAQLGAQYWAQLGASNLRFLLPNADIKGVRDPENPEFEQRADGSWKVVEKKQKTIPEPELSAQEKIEANPMWGMF